ncbi:MAG: 1-deoxy-D-xylulose-5-phosphate synthase [Eubacteriales bacterium]|nr:1-deoxy-D-xylulose-5-phosphate synthase [Eubacteriales bacterium]
MTIDIFSPKLSDDVKLMTVGEAELLAYEIRSYLLDNISKTGGHLASNLGVVELTIALHRVFSTPKDKLIWDVGHQAYVHKILTGRAAQFPTLRQKDGLSGFPKRAESSHDCFYTGHSSNSISVAAGMAVARDLSGQDYNVVAIIGDGALTGGMAYEALNNVGAMEKNLIVILNDNGMSISKNIGGISQHLNRLRTSKGYIDFKKVLKETLKKIPGVGEGIYSGMEHVRDLLKYTVVDGIFFEEMGFKYLGPIDGHDVEEVTDALLLAKRVNGPVVVHTITQKGKGYRNAERDPGRFHGIGPFETESGACIKPPETSYSQTFGNMLCRLAEKDQRITAVCAAMECGTGLTEFARKFPQRIFDVGIAEEHAVTFAAGMATQGFRPVVAIYSTFLQRAYDQILIDVCLQNLPVIFAIDRAGNVGNDGETHHGVFDISYLSHMPNMKLLAPMDGKELEEMLEYSLQYTGPVAIRYPRGSSKDLNISRRTTFNGKSTVLKEGKHAEIISVGNMTSVALAVSERLLKAGYDVGIINAAVISPPDRDTILSALERTGKIITIEDNVLNGGFGQTVNTLALNVPGAKVLNIGWPQKFIEHGNTKELFKAYSLDEESIEERIRQFIEG